MIEAYTDGGSTGNPGPAGAGVALYANRQLVCSLSISCGHSETSNVAEYIALILALVIVASFQVPRISVFTDSKLVANQVDGGWKINKQRLRTLN